MPLTPTCEILLTRTSAESGALEMLLGLKKRGLGRGKLVGPGGHIEPGESPRAACVRELEEETGLVVDAADLRDLGGIAFRFPAKPDLDLHLAVFACDRFAGELVETDELTPGWYPVDAPPFERMWDDAKHWLPRALASEKLPAEIVLAEDNETVAEVR